MTLGERENAIILPFLHDGESLSLVLFKSSFVRPVAMAASSTWKYEQRQWESWGGRGTCQVAEGRAKRGRREIWHADLTWFMYSWHSSFACLIRSAWPFSTRIFHAKFSIAFKEDKGRYIKWLHKTKGTGVPQEPWQAFYEGRERLTRLSFFPLRPCWMPMFCRSSCHSKPACWMCTS